jgi:hypothetical protein
MHPAVGLRLVSECEDLNPTAQKALSMQARREALGSNIGVAHLEH